jgi:hypothetical protein
MPASALYYRHSGRFSPQGLGMLIGVGTASAILLGLTYAFIDLWNPIAGYVTFLVTGGTGWVMGIILGKLIQKGKMRNVPLGMGIALLLIFLMYVMSWEFWIYAFLRRAGEPVSMLDVFLHPAGVWEFIREVNAGGTFSIKGSVPKGIFLTLLWLAEAGALVGIPIAMAWSALHELPFCENCNKWCSTRELITLNAGEKATIRAELEARNFAALTALGKAPGTSQRCWRAFFQGCADCDTTQTLCIEEVSITVDKKGDASTKTTSVLRRLTLTSEDTVAVAMSIAPLMPPEEGGLDSEAAPTAVEPSAAPPSENA